MPLFMDRHFVSGATAKSVAEAHQLDLKNQERFGCKALTYWFDENTAIAFCLIEGPNENAVIEMHRNTHGLIPNQIIEVNGNLVKLFMGRICDPETAKGSDEFEKFINETGYRAILKIKLRYDLLLNEKAAEINDPANNLIQQLINSYDGREVPTADEGILAAFTSVSNSVRCALELKEKFELMNNENPKVKSNAIIGLSLGQPVTEGNKIFEDTVKLVERFCDIPDGSKVILSSTIRNAIKDTNLNLSIDKSVKILDPSEEKFLNKLMDLTEQGWKDEKFNVDNLCKQIGLSRAQLYRKVTSLTGCSPNEFIREYRLVQSIKLFLKKTGNISEIAFESGFNNPSYFSKCFHKKFGILPSNYVNSLA